MELAEAQIEATEILKKIAPFCVEIAIAGSVRRRRPEVNDIEIVLIPKEVPDMNALLPMYVRCPDLIDAINKWPAVRGEPTGKYTRRIIRPGVEVDFFLVDRDNWGLQLALRTGSAEFSHHVLAHGWCVAGCEGRGGHLFRGDKMIPVRTEHELFELIGHRWVEPELREYSHG